MNQTKEQLTQQIGKQLVAVCEVARELEEVGDLESARAEAERAAEKAVDVARQAAGERDMALEELQIAQDDLVIARKKAKDLLPAAEARAKAVEAATAVKAGGMIAVAQKAVGDFAHRLDLLEEEHVIVVAKYAKEEAAARERTSAILAELSAVEKRLSG